jgi:hypothetical protein
MGFVVNSKNENLELFLCFSIKIYEIAIKSHRFFRASFPNLVVLVNHCWNVAGHPRGFPKWYIRKYSVWHFLRNRPIVEISGDFHNKLTIFSAFCLTFRTILTHSG